MSENDKLWYVQLSLRTNVDNELDVQTFCNQCGELVLQESSESNCEKCQSDKWASPSVSKTYRQMLIKIQQDPNFRYNLKIKYKNLWNEKFPKYKIPDPDKVGKLIPSSLEKVDNG